MCREQWRPLAPEVWRSTTVGSATILERSLAPERFPTFGKDQTHPPASRHRRTLSPTTKPTQFPLWGRGPAPRSPSPARCLTRTCWVGRTLPCLQLRGFATGPAPPNPGCLGRHPNLCPHACNEYNHTHRLVKYTFYLFIQIV